MPIGEFGQSNGLRIKSQEKQTFVALLVTGLAFSSQVFLHRSSFIAGLLEPRNQTLLILGGEAAGVGDGCGGIGARVSRTQCENLQRGVVGQRRSIAEARLTLGHAATLAAGRRFSRHSRNTSIISASISPLTSLAASSARLRTLRPLPRGSSS